jgi:fermentation-respiration switch protein FrsA (DUF1100 family)
MAERLDVEFTAEGGIKLRAWLYIPEGPGPHPAITMAHGYAGTRAHGLAAYASRFADNGFVVLVHDHRNFGASEGELRHDINPWQQIKDWRRAVTYLEGRPEVDASRIGLWGSSYSGGHALVLGATEQRLKAVVSQVPAINGHVAGSRRAIGDAKTALEQSFVDDERDQAAGKAPRMIAVVSSDPSQPAAYRVPSAVRFYTQPGPEEFGWDNTVTLQSTRAARLYEPGVWASRVSPKPLLFIVAADDELTGTDLALEAYEQAQEPKSLVMLPGGHFEPYVENFEDSSSAALSWFLQHL